MKSVSLTISALLCLFVNASAFAQEAPSNPKSIEEIFTREFNAVTGTTTGVEKEEERRKILATVLEGLSLKELGPKIQAGLILNRVAKPTDLQLLIRALKDKAPDVIAQKAIVKTLGKLGEASSVDALRYEYDNGSRELQLAIIDAMGGIRDDASIRFLSQFMRSGTPELQTRAIAALGRIGGDRAAYVISSGAKFPPGTPQHIASAWVLTALRGEVSRDKTDTTIDEGRKQKLYFEGTPYWYYEPVMRKDDNSKNWLLVCVHGSELNAEFAFDTCLTIAKLYKISLLAPFFDPVRFPDYPTFNLEGDRADAWFTRLIEFLGKNAKVKTKEIYLFGYERGGDFVQRYVLANPEKIARAAAFPVAPMEIDTHVYFPTGIGPTPLAKDLNFDMLKVTKTDFALVVGPESAKDRNFRRYFEGLLKAGEENSVASRIRLRQVDQKGASLPGAWDNVQKFLFPSE